MSRGHEQVLAWLRANDVPATLVDRVRALLEQTSDARLAQTTITPSVRIRLHDNRPDGRLSLLDLVRAARAGRLGDVEVPPCAP